jgi:ketosteroid isomerase-like protein
MHPDRAAFARAWLLLFLAAACRTASVQQPPEAAPAELRHAFVGAFNRGDVATLKAFYASGAVLLTFGGQAISGAETIADGLQHASAAFDLELEPVRAETSATFIYGAGTWRHLEKGSTAVRDSGTYLWVWRKDANGRWQISAHSVTRKVPASGR